MVGSTRRNRQEMTMLATRNVPAVAVLADATRQKRQEMTLSATRGVPSVAVPDAPLFARALHGETVDAALEMLQALV